MEKEFVPYELALRMKQLGFDEPCFGFYDESLYFPNNKNQYGTFCNQKLDAPSCSAPLFRQAFRWFREKYNLDGYVSVDVWNMRTSSYRITGGIKGHIEADSYGSLYDIDSKEYEVYEEAELACLERLIEIVEQK